MCYLKSVVRPASKLHITALVIERKPGDVNGTRGLEHARGDVGAQPLAGHNNIGREGGVKRFACTETFTYP